MPFRRLLSALLLALVALPAFAGEAIPSISIDDLYKIITPSDPQISPDGKTIVFILSRANKAENRNDSDLVAIDIATAVQRTLTFERKKLSSPRFSPSGDRLAFLAKAPGEKGEEQIYVLPMNGGDARRVTDAAAGVQHFAWRPDGRAIAFASSDEAPKRKDEEKNLDAFEITNHDLLVSGEIRAAHLWVVNLESGEAKRVTSGSWSLPIAEPPGPAPSPLSWSPDNKSVLITKQKTPVYGDSDLSVIAIADTNSGKVREITGKPSLEGVGSFSPDGTRVAYWYPREGDATNETEIYVAPAAGGPGRSVTRSIDRSITRALWMPDGKSLLVGAHDRDLVALWVQPLDGAPRRLDLGEVSPSWSYWVDMSVSSGNAIAFTGSEPNHPRELYFMESLDAKPRRLTTFNDEIAQRATARVAEISWKNDGFDENAIVLYPPGFDAAKKYPLVLLIHGGPNSSSVRTFSLPAQAMAARGWIVFQPNYRGSDNLGNAYMHAIANDSGEGPGRDVLAGIDALKKGGFIDEKKIAVSGWSYGGYMTSWLIGHYDIWKVAVSGAAVNNLVHEYALSDNNVTVRYGLGGSPYDPKYAKAYIEQSPITYAHRVKTPTLILTNTGDVRVPATQSFEMYHALKDNGVEVKFFAYPVGGHFPGDPARSADVYRRWIAWIEEHFAK